MNKKRFKKTLILSTFSCLALITIFASFNIKSKASSVPYYSTYKDIVKIEDHSSFTATQGMSITSGKAFYTKLNNNTGKIRIWMYNLSTQKKYVVYNGNSSKTEFDMGHANSLYVDSKYMYVATMTPNEESIYRYNINYSNGKYYLSNKKAYFVYSHNKSNTNPISVAALEYSAYLDKFIVKSGKHLYIGNFVDNTFKWTKHYSLGSTVQVQGKTKLETLDLSEYTHQGMYCRSNVLYLPFMKTNNKNVTIVVAYTLDKNLANNSVLKEKASPFIRITSQKYQKLFEIEEVAYYNGQMYANVNATYTEGGNNDRIIRINDFYY